MTPPIHLFSISPDTGSHTGGTQVTITGQDIPMNVDVRVTFGPNLATAVNVPDNQTLTCAAPVGLVGVVTITVLWYGPQGNLYQSASLVNAFTYSPGLPPIGNLYDPHWNHIDWSQPGGTGTKVFPAQNDGPFLDYPVPGQFIAEAGEALWRAGCGHGFDDFQVFRDYDDVTSMSAAIQCCPICTFIVAIIEPYELISDVRQYPILV